MVKMDIDTVGNGLCAVPNPPSTNCLPKATPHNGSYGLQRIFCPNRAV